MFAFVEFPDCNAQEGHGSFVARQLNRFLHEPFYYPEWEQRGITQNRFRYSWWRPEHPTTLNLGFEINPDSEAIRVKLVWLRELFPGALRAQIFSPELGIPTGAEIQPRRSTPAEVIPIANFRKRQVA